MSKYKLSNYERAIGLYRNVLRSNQKLIDTQDSLPAIEFPKTKTPEEVSTKSMNPIKELIEYIDSIVYSSNIPISDKIYELNIARGRISLDETSPINKEARELYRRAVHDLEDIKNSRIDISTESLTKAIAVGDITKVQAFKKIIAKMAEIDDALNGAIEDDFIKNGDIGIFTDSLTGKVSIWTWLEDPRHILPDNKVSKLIESTMYSTRDIEDLFKLGKTLEGEIPKEMEEAFAEGKTSRNENLEAGADVPATNPEPIRIPYSKLADIAAFWKSNEASKYLSEADFCAQYRQADGSKIRRGSLRQAWNGTGLYAKRSGRDVLREWMEAENKNQPRPPESTGRLLGKQ